MVDFSTKEIHAPIYLPKLNHFCHSVSSRAELSSVTQRVHSPWKMYTLSSPSIQPCSACTCTQLSTTQNDRTRAGHSTVLHTQHHFLFHCTFTAKMHLGTAIVFSFFHPFTGVSTENGLVFLNSEKPWNQRWWVALLEQLLPGCTSKRLEEICNRRRNDSRSSTDTSLTKRWSIKLIETKFSFRSPTAKMLGGWEIFLSNNLYRLAPAFCSAQSSLFFTHYWGKEKEKKISQTACWKRLGL